MKRILQRLRRNKDGDGDTTASDAGNWSPQTGVSVASSQGPPSHVLQSAYGSGSSPMQARDGQPVIKASSGEAVITMDEVETPSQASPTRESIKAAQVPGPTSPVSVVLATPDVSRKPAVPQTPVSAQALVAPTPDSRGAEDGNGVSEGSEEAPASDEDVAPTAMNILFENMQQTPKERRIERRAAHRAGMGESMLKFKFKRFHHNTELF